jgi:hypothetical protein
MMSEITFDARLQVIEEQHTARQEHIDGRRDQALARLFLEADWSQEKLAAHLAKRRGKEVSRSWVEHHLRYGRFLSFFDTGRIKDEFAVPPNLTEWAFRKFWEATSPGGDYRGHKANTEAAQKDERRRFAEIIDELKVAGLSRKKKPVQSAIVKKVAGRAEWLTAAQIAERVSPDFDSPVLDIDVVRSLRGFTTKPDTPYRVEKAGEGDTAKYRVVKVKGQIVSRKQVAAWSHDLIPMIDELITEARKDRVEISLSTLCALASKIKKVLEGVVAQTIAEK